jgi:hypothetical protein
MRLVPQHGARRNAERESQAATMMPARECARNLSLLRAETARSVTGDD